MKAFGQKMNNKAYVVNNKDGRKREIDLRGEPEPINKKETYKQNVVESEIIIDPPFATLNSPNVSINPSRKFTPTMAPPLPGKVNISTLKEVAKPIVQPPAQIKHLPVQEGDLSNIENITRLEDGRVAITRIFKSYEDAIGTIKPQKPQPKPNEPCNLCGSSFEKHGYKLVCPYCYYEKL